MLIQLFKKMRHLNKKSQKKMTPPQNVTIITSRDIKAIAGDNVLATQLDLAKAYVELGKKNLARQILTHVLKNGDHHQQQIAQELMRHL